MTDKAVEKNTAQEKTTKDHHGHRQKNWRKNRQPRRYEAKKKDPEEIPVLKYGPANNFSKFKEALSNTALKEYGVLGKLIKQGTYAKIEPKEPNDMDYKLDADPYGVNREKYLEDCKEYRKEMAKMRENKPKLYGLIMQYLSDESKDEIKRQDKYDDIEKTADPEGLWRLVEETHKVTSISKVEAVTKLAARTTYQNMRQGPYESIITYKERFDNAKKAYEDQGNPAMGDIDIAMDFFRGLDNNRYGHFKTQIMNDLTSKAIEQPANLNEMYLLANQWLQVKTTTNAMGFGTTFTTTLDYQEKPKKGKKNTKGKKDEESPKKEEKKERDMSKVECYACGETGHYAGKCPARLKKDEPQDEERHSHLTWTNASAFTTTYQVHNALKAGLQFGRKEVLLDNQANVSIDLI